MYENYSRSLVFVGHSMLDHDLVYSALVGLDSNRNSFISNITLCSSPISFNELYNHLLAHDRILDQQFSNSMFNENIVKFGGLNIVSKLQDSQVKRYTNNFFNCDVSTKNNWNLLGFLSQQTWWFCF